MNPKALLAVCLFPAIGVGYGAGYLMGRQAATRTTVEVERPVEVVKEIVVPCPVCTAVAETSEPEVPDEEPEPTAVDLNDLAAAYRENEVAADLKYKGKRLRVRGHVYVMERAHAGYPVVTVSGTGAFIKCRFPTTEEAAVAELRPNQKVVVTGECVGVHSAMVVLHDCSLMGDR